MCRSPMVQADSLMPGTCYWSASNAELGGDRRAEAVGRFLAELRKLAGGSALWTASATADVIIPVCEGRWHTEGVTTHVSRICWPIDLKS
jgi:hypothetical protein